MKCPAVWRRVSALGLCVLSAALVPGSLSAQALTLPGCPRAHCDGANSDLTLMPVPVGIVGLVWISNDLASERAGSLSGLGCSSDTVVAVCSYAGLTDNVIAYDYDGNRLWTSGELLSGYAFSSAPLILPDGDIVMADHQRVVKFDRSGDVVWNTRVPFGGFVISPVLTENGVIVLATRRGPVTAIDNETGTVLGFTFIKSGPSDPGFFDTRNTPAVKGNRVYIVMQHQTSGAIETDRPGRLVAIDVDPEASEPMTVAWFFDGFLPLSNSSPLLIDDVLLFDGRQGPSPAAARAHLFGVLDRGSSAQELWRVRLESSSVASLARDPRDDGGFWHKQWNRPSIWRRSVDDGSLLQQIDVQELMGELGTYSPLSATTIAQGAAGPLVVVSMRNPIGATYIVAIDVVNEALVWKIKVSDSGGVPAAGQFSILDGGPGSGTRIVFTMSRGGARAIGSLVSPF